MMRVIRVLFACAVLGAALPTGNASRASPTEDREAIAALLAKDDFAALDATFAAWLKEVQQGARSEWDLDRAYGIFRTSDPAIGESLDRWVEKGTSSLAAHVARALFRVHVVRLSLGEDIGASDQVKRRAAAAAQARAIGHMGTAYGPNELTAPETKLPVGLAAIIDNAIWNGRTTEAEDFFRLMLIQVPDSALIYRAYARGLEPWWSATSPSVEVALGTLKGFIEDAQRHFADNPDFAWLNGYAETVEAELFRRRGFHPEAIDAYTRALALAELPERYFGRGLSHALSGDNAAALADFEKAAALDPGFADAWSQMGGRRRLMGQFAAALADYDRAVALDPLNPEFLVGRASVLVRLGRMPDAQADVDKALTYGEMSAWVQTWRAFVYRDTDPALAAEAEKRAAELKQAPAP